MWTDPSMDRMTLCRPTSLVPIACLEEARSFFNTLSEDEKTVSFSSCLHRRGVWHLKLNDPAFKETNQYEPNSPYSASKAASDHLVRAWHHTYGLPVLTTNCSNNYGPYHFPEKLIPLCILKALQGQDLPIYGDGSKFVTGSTWSITARGLLPF